MGIEWMNGIVEILTAGGIRAGEAFSAGKRMEIASPVAAVGLRDLNWQEGLAEFEIRIVSPRSLGGWQCQAAAAEALAALEDAGVHCRMEPMAYQAGLDCFEMVVIGEQSVFEKESEDAQEAEAGYLEVLIGDSAVPYVTEFTAEQDRQRRLIGALNQAEPVGVTPSAGGWSIRLVQEVPQAGQVPAEPEEPFVLTVKEEGLTTAFTGCCWNKVKKQMDQTRIKVEWEGFALSREETTDG